MMRCNSLAITIVCLGGVLIINHLRETTAFCSAVCHRFCSTTHPCNGDKLTRYAAATSQRVLFDEIVAVQEIQDLPIYNIIDSIRSSLQDKPNLLLEAMPGAGKTTCIPLLLSSRPLPSDSNNSKTEGKVIVVEPRRVATRSAAQRMSRLLGQDEVGNSIGYVIRGESKQSSNTSILVMTDGVLLNIIRDDPEMKDYDTVILDEFHERGIGSDTALALLRVVQMNYRPDLKIVIMSATLLGSEDSNSGGDEESTGSKLLRIMGGTESCNILRSEGRQFPITMQYSSRTSPRHGALLRDTKLLVETMANAIEEALMKAPARGYILAFFARSKRNQKMHNRIKHTCWIERHYHLAFIWHHAKA
jgi:ATP-dependent helicase HrpB